VKIVELKSYKVAVNEYGDPSSVRFVLMLPGRLDTKDYRNFVLHGEFLASKGFFCVCFDPPGTWDSPGDIAQYSTTRYIQVVQDLIEFYGAKDITLLGHSRGGAVAMLSTVISTVHSLVLINAAYHSPTAMKVDSQQKGYQEEFRDFPPGNARTEHKKRFELPLNYFEDGSQYDPAGALKRFTGKKIIFHASQDEFCDASAVKLLYDELDDPKYMEVIAGKHDYRLYPEAIHRINNVLAEELLV
jgi:esterase/lipase